MIAAWMLFTVAVTLLLLAAAAAADHVARALRAPTRVVWAVAMMVAIGLSARALYTGLNTRSQTTPFGNKADVHVGLGTLDDTGFTTAHSSNDITRPSLSSSISGVASAIARVLGSIEQSATRFDVRHLDRWNGTLVALWVGASGVALLLLAVSFTRLRRMERSFATTTLRDYPVLVSRELGPAVLGVLRSRVVLPEWVLTLPGRERDVILAHEREHAAAFDPALIAAATILVALQPWNIGLWGLLARLRVALEGDCDRRVLDALGSGDERWYGRLLISVYEKTTLGAPLGVGFVARPSNLERRVRRILLRPRIISVTGATSVLAAALLVVTACRASAPVRQVRPLLVVKESVASPVVEGSISLPSERQSQSTEAAAQAMLSAARTIMSAARDVDHPPDKRCSLVDRKNELPSGQRSVLWPGQWPVNAGCSLFGDIVVVYVDSTNVLVAARDTADVGITAFFVFQTKPGTITSDLVWSTTSGRAELSDTSMTFISPAAGTKPLVLRLRSTTGNAYRTDAIELKIDQLMMAEMQGIPWETIARLPASPRCTATERESDSTPSVGPGRPSPGITNDMRRACFMTGGSRFQFPIFANRQERTR